jgi:hypothetical protein
VTGPFVAYAVVRDDPPSVYVAEDLDVLQRALALNLVARTETSRVSVEERNSLRAALLDEQWGDAVHAWINHTGIAIDVYTERVLTADDLPADLIGAQLQFAPLFRGD